MERVTRRSARRANIGLFGMFELVRNRATYEPMAPFNGTSSEMQALGRAFRDAGLYTFVRWNTFFTNPPLIITEARWTRRSRSSIAASS